MHRRAFLASLSGMAALLLSGCERRERHVTVGSKNFTEQLVLGELLAQLLERRLKVPVERRFYLAGTYICQQAILAGRIDLYVEYTGTALAAILKQPVIPDPQAVFEIVREQYRRRFNLVVMPSLGFSNTFAIVMRGNDARASGITKLSELAAYAPKMRMGVGYEFLERPDGYAGLAKTYGLRFTAPPVVMDLGLLYRALEAKQVDVVAGSNTDGMIAALGLTALEDDKHYFPPYDAVPIVRPETLQQFDGMQTALQQLAGRISTQDMRRMNYAVDGEKLEVSSVVSDFLNSLPRPSTPSTLKP
ncbi:MAG: glycine betaine ABC transporter substrate-binding protein [Candidatus Korobacteraceae bacterium]